MIERALVLIKPEVVARRLTGVLLGCYLRERMRRVSRWLHGATDPSQVAPGRVRGDSGESLRRNWMHASDSAESAAREIALCFPGLA